MKIKKFLFKIVLILVFLYFEYSMYAKYKQSGAKKTVNIETVEETIISKEKIRHKDFYLNDKEIKNYFVFKENLSDPVIPPEEIETVEKTTYRNNIPLNTKSEIKVTKNKIPEKKQIEIKQKKEEPKKVEVKKVENKKEPPKEETIPKTNEKVTEIEGIFINNPL